MKLLSRVAGSCLSVACLFGCGGSSMEQGKDVESQVAAVLLAVNDAAGSEADFNSMFVGGAAPEGREKYFNAKIDLVEDPEVSGNEATAQVKISQGAAESEGDGGPKGEDVGSGEVTWTLQKQGDSWKLKDAPLP